METKTMRINGAVVAVFAAVVLAAVAVMLSATNALAYGDESDDERTLIKAGGAYYSVWVNDMATNDVVDVDYEGPVSKKKTSYIVPKTVKFKYNGRTITGKVTHIGVGAFKNCKKAKKVTIKANVGVIPSRAFYGCKNLRTVKAKAYTIYKIEEKAFQGCTKLSTVPKFSSCGRVMDIQPNAFKNCVSLKSITVKITKPGMNQECWGLTIHDDAFANCKKLKVIKRVGRKKSQDFIRDKAFRGCKNFTGIKYYKS